MGYIDVEWSGNPCILIAGGDMSALRKYAQSIAIDTGFPTWHIRPEDADSEITETLEELLRDGSERKLLIFEGNTHKFSTDTGYDMLSDFFWFPNLCQTRTTLLVLVENLSQDNFYHPLSTSKYHVDIGLGVCSGHLLGNLVTSGKTYP